MAQSAPFVAKFAGKVVEGGVNAFFAIRMGRKAVAAFELSFPRKSNALIVNANLEDSFRRADRR